MRRVVLLSDTVKLLDTYDLLPLAIVPCLGHDDGFSVSMLKRIELPLHGIFVGRADDNYTPEVVIDNFGAYVLVFNKK